MRIDAHAHAVKLERDTAGKARVTSSWDGRTTPASYVADCRAHGIEGIVLIEPEDLLFPLWGLFPDFVIPVATVEIDAVTPSDIAALVGRGARGIKFIAPSRAYGDDRYFPLYDAVRSCHALAVFHTGFLIAGLFEPGKPLARPFIVNIEDMRPATLDRVARAFPDLKILMAHFGNPWWEEAWKMVSSHPNLFADLSGGTACRRSMDMWARIFAPDGKLDEVAVGKLCFASDMTYLVPGRRDFLPYCDFYDRLCDRLKAPAELREKIDSGNIRMLTELP